MKLILRADVDALGRLGDIVSVKPGYGRNYLVPQGLAKPATNANLKLSNSNAANFRNRLIPFVPRPKAWLKRSHPLR